MPRPLRIHAPDALYHVTNRGVERRAIFIDDMDRCRFLGMLKAALKAHHAHLFSYCLMPNHFHLLIAITEIPLGFVMHDLETQYALYFNHRHERVGHLFQGRYHAELCRNDGYLVQVVAYIHLNPVKAKLVERPGDWAWSGHRELVALGSELMDFVHLERLTGFTVKEFRDLYFEKLREPPAPRDEAEAIRAAIARSTLRHGISPHDLRSGQKQRAISRAREELATWAASAGISDARLADVLGCSRSTLTRARLRNVTVRA